MKGPQEYEVESITRARVHDKKGKKITWKFYVKWKGYDWDDCTWEPAESFSGGSENLLESFWERVDTGGRDSSDASAFKKGEELFVAGPPGRKPLKRKAKNQVSPPSDDISASNGAAISAPPLSHRKRRRMQVTVDDEWGYSKPRRVPTGLLKSGRTSSKVPKRRRASSPGPRKSASKRLPSAGDSQLDADGETDPDVAEVEDELMQRSIGDTEEGATRARDRAPSHGIPNGSKKIAFDDLEPFYSGHPIDIDQNPDEVVASSLPTDDAVSASEPQAPASPTDYDPLFDSPPRSAEKAPEIQGEPTLPPHRARAAKPLVKLIETTMIEGASEQSRITAKARLMSGNIAKPGGKPGPGRSSSGLLTRNRSSLLTVTKGALKSVVGKFASPMECTTERDHPDEIEEDVAGQGLQATSNLQPPSGDELLKLAGLETGPEPLPDYEDEPAAPPEEVEEMQIINVAPETAEEQPPNQPLVEVSKEFKASDHVADTALPIVPEAGQPASTPVVGDPSTSFAIAPPADEVVKKNIELAKEHLFPTTPTSFDPAFSTGQSSFHSTIFGPLYQGSAANSVPAVKNGSSTTFKMFVGNSIELPLVLKDFSELKARISDITIGRYSGKVGIFYSSEDALAMINTLKSNGTARVVLDPSAEALQQESFSTLEHRFQSYVLIAPVSEAVCVLYSSEDAVIAEKLGVPTALRGLSNTILITHASIESHLAYVDALIKATAYPFWC